jgi:hypothetical protein
MTRVTRQVLTGVVVAVGVIVLLVLVYKTLAAGAREDFASKYSCPNDRVVVTPRPDISSLKANDMDVVLTPPPEVAKDPDRLAKWNEDQAKNRKRDEENYDDDVFEVSGCDHRVIMACHHMGSSKGQGIRFDSVSCHESKMKL